MAREKYQLHVTCENQSEVIAIGGEKYLIGRGKHGVRFWYDSAAERTSVATLIAGTFPDVNVELLGDVEEEIESEDADDDPV